MVNRIRIEPGLMSVSLPGIDVMNPPAISYKYLALDSRLRTERPLEMFHIPYCIPNSQSWFYFSETYAYPPYAELIWLRQVDGSMAWTTNLRVVNNSGGGTYGNWDTTPWAVKVEESRLQIVPMPGNPAHWSLSSPYYFIALLWRMKA